jgi:hypothetical protein
MALNVDTLGTMIHPPRTLRRLSDMHALDTIIKRNQEAAIHELGEAIVSTPARKLSHKAVGIVNAMTEGYAVENAILARAEPPWPGYTPEAQAYELRTRHTACGRDLGYETKAVILCGRLTCRVCYPRLCGRLTCRVCYPRA